MAEATGKDEQPVIERSRIEVRDAFSGPSNDLSNGVNEDSLSKTAYTPLLRRAIPLSELPVVAYQWLTRDGRKKKPSVTHSISI